SGCITNPEALHSIWIFDDIAGSAKQGFVLPESRSLTGDFGIGNDVKWAKGYLGEFEKRAAGGNEGMRGLAEDVRS
ncbi:hypothetical protein BU23DRAFT_425885, partial [Bimuria novae-zelandiae CBS 107.79]